MSDRLPIVVFSFDRPEYLSQALASLSAELARSHIPADVFLFQDGAVNPFSGTRYADDANISACMSTFKKIFPSGNILYSPDNLGVGLNYDRAERFVFDTLKAPIACFFEDDLLLESGYLTLLEKLMNFALQNDHVGMVSCYGAAHSTKKVEQISRKQHFAHMGHSWGFALTRRHWLKRQPALIPYMEMISKVDYRLRPDDAIGGWRAGLGFSRTPTSQDDCKNIISLKQGVARLTTFANFARYIGVRGVHMTEEEYNSSGYKDSWSMPYDGFDIAMPTDAEISDLIFTHIANRFKDNIDERFSRPVTRDHVIWAYRLLYGREPESDRAIEGKMNTGNTINMMRIFLDSPEFRAMMINGLDLAGILKV
jgi:hypothetical protein